MSQATTLREGKYWAGAEGEERALPDAAGRQQADGEDAHSGRPQPWSLRGRPRAAYTAYLGRRRRRARSRSRVGRSVRPLKLCTPAQSRLSLRNMHLVGARQDEAFEQVRPGLSTVGDIGALLNYLRWRSLQHGVTKSARWIWPMCGCQYGLRKKSLGSRWPASS